MTPYQKLCILRDQRRAGEEAPQFTELEAFEAATATQPAQAHGEAKPVGDVATLRHDELFDVYAKALKDRGYTSIEADSFGLMAVANHAISAALASQMAAPRYAAQCWNCKKPYTMQQRIDADGMCPHCVVELEEIPTIETSIAQPALQHDAKREEL